MMIEIAGPLTLCMKDQETYTRSKAKCIKKETMHSITIQEEEIPILEEDTEDEEEKEWTKFEEKYFVTTAHSQDI
jgi:hypothetical protein